MNIAVMTIAFNEKETIKDVLSQWESYKHIILLSKTPWRGNIDNRDSTKEIAKNWGVEVIEHDWETETEQRNWGLDYLSDYDYVLIVDADELYTDEDREKIVSSLGTDDCYVAQNMEVYWKTTDYVLEPRDKHKPVIAVKPICVRFIDKRDVNTGWRPPIDVTMHHLSFCKSDQKMLEKIQTFEHADEIPDDWYERFLNWQPSDRDIHPYKKGHRAIYKPLPINVCSSQILQIN